MSQTRMSRIRTVALARSGRYRALNRRLLAAPDFATAFRVIAEYAVRTLPIDGAVLFLREGATLRTAATWNLAETPPPPALNTALSRVLRDRRPILLNQARDLGGDVGLDAAALLALPIETAGEPLGVLALINQVNPAAFVDDDLELARFFADQAAVAVHSMRLATAVGIQQEIIAAFHRFALSLGASPQLNDILHKALQVAGQSTGSRHGTVLLLDDSGEHIRFRVALDDGNIAPLEMIAKPMMSKGLAGWVVRERRAALVNDTERDRRWLPGPGSGDLRSAIVAPLLRGERVLGIMTLGHDQPGHYTEQHLQLLEILGAQAALAIENAQLSDAINRAARPTLSSPNDLARQQPGARPPSERPSVREVVAISTRLRGLVAASARLAPEVMVDEALNLYFQTMAEIIGRHNGYMERAAGDTLLAIFGHPESGPDDVAQAVQAVLEMQDAASRLRTHWRTRLSMLTGGLDVGIARGRVVISGIDTPPPRYDTVIGDAVNLAAQLRDLARAGEILTTAEIVDALDQSGKLFTIEALQPLQAPGALPRHNYRIDKSTSAKGASTQR
jgi:GAF domain-containing protein